jgi:hypothetical protein
LAAGAARAICEGVDQSPQLLEQAAAIDAEAGVSVTYRVGTADRPGSFLCDKRHSCQSVDPCNGGELGGANRKKTPLVLWSNWVVMPRISCSESRVNRAALAS